MGVKRKILLSIVVVFISFTIGVILSGISENIGAAIALLGFVLIYFYWIIQAFRWAINKIKSNYPAYQRRKAEMKAKYRATVMQSIRDKQKQRDVERTEKKRKRQEILA